MDKLILYAYTFRSRAERVLWTLRELELPHRVVRLDPMKGETRTTEFLKLNPAAKIPVLIHGERVLTESVAIMEYLNDISATRHLIPIGTQDNYRFRQVLHFGLTEVEPYLWLADQAERLKQGYRWPEGTTEDSLRLARKHIAVVWEWLDPEGFIASEQFSLADIYFYQLISWARRHGVATPEHAQRYMQRLELRKSFPEEMRTSS
jgi:glutathione S-transferase